MFSFYSWDIIGWIILAIAMSAIIVGLANFVYTLIKDAIDKRRRRREEHEYLVNLFKHPVSKQEKPSHFYSSEEESLRNIIWEYSEANRLVKLERLLEVLLEELGYDVHTISTGSFPKEKFKLTKKTPF